MNDPVRRLLVRKLVEDPELAGLFPGMEEELRRFLADPGCGCNAATIDAIVARLAGAGPRKRASWHVIDCAIDSLENELRERHQHSNGSFAVAIEGDRAVVVVRET